MEIRIVEAADYVEPVRALIAEYTAGLNRDLTFQHLQEELAGLEERYFPPNGRLLAAIAGEQPVGCVALRRLEAGRCEMKRLYVRPDFRGQQIGRRLAEAILELARAEGYAEMVLDTLQPMTRAVALYRDLGFQEIPAYYQNPYPDVVYMRLDLLAEAPGEKV